MHRHSIIIGKAIKKLASLRGGGSALPGLIIEKLDKDFLKRALHQLPHGVVLITGTNGKTTTTKIVSELLEAGGWRVFTNRTGSNFTRGIVAALLGVIKPNGTLDYDVAVLELDEAYAVKFAEQVAPDYVLVLNVMRDQLDRFGEIDHTKELISRVIKQTTKGVTLNADDPRVFDLHKVVPNGVKINTFGSSSALRKLFVSDDELHGKKSAANNHDSDIVLNKLAGQNAEFIVSGHAHQVSLKLKGAYNFLNAAGALALCQQLLGELNPRTIEKLSSIEPAFGRGESLVVNDQSLELVLVKNPAGFRLALSSFNPSDSSTMIAINDQYADGRDMSWLWDVDFTSLSNAGVSTASGVRAYDMALRLQYDNVIVKNVQTDLAKALKVFLNDSDKPKRIFCTYTAMLTLRQALKKHTDVKRID